MYINITIYNNIYIYIPKDEKMKISSFIVVSLFIMVIITAEKIY